MDSHKNTVGRAGFLYLLMVLTCFFSLDHAPKRLRIEGDAVTTINSIAQAEWTPAVVRHLIQAFTVGEFPTGLWLLITGAKE